MGAESERPFKEQVESPPLKIQPGMSVVVGCEFILQVYFTQTDLRLQNPAHLGIFALSQTPIKPEGARVKKAKSQKQKHAGKVKFLFRYLFMMVKF